MLGVLLSLSLLAGYILMYTSTFTAARWAGQLGVIFAFRIMHDTMLQRIARAPMSFFDTTPLGRILNRFSKAIH